MSFYDGLNPGESMSYSVPMRCSSCFYKADKIFPVGQVSDFIYLCPACHSLTFEKLH